jgi:Tfp pilus assembly protein PilF
VVCCFSAAGLLWIVERFTEVPLWRQIRSLLAFRWGFLGTARICGTSAAVDERGAARREWLMQWRWKFLVAVAVLAVNLRLFDTTWARCFPLEFCLGQALTREGRPDDAMMYFKRSVHLGQQVPESRVEMGRIYLGRGDLASAKWLLDVALGEAPDYPHAWSNLGAVHTARGARDDAERAFRRALDIDRRHAPAWIGLAGLRMDSGRAQDAADLLTRAVRVTPEQATLRFHLGRACLRLGQPDQAVAQWEAALRTDPFLAEARLELARLYDAAGEWTLAEKHLRRGAKLNRQSGEVHIELARFLLRHGRTAEAAEALRSAGDVLPPSDPRVEDLRRTLMP